MRAFNPGAFIQGAEMAKQSNRQQEAADRQNKKSDLQIEAMQNKLDAQNELIQDSRKQTIYKSISKAFSDGTSESSSLAVEELNMLSPDRKNSLFVLDDTTKDAGLAYLREEELNTTPYMVDPETGKIRPPNALDATEVYAASQNASRDDMKILENMANSGMLLRDSNGGIVSFEELAAVTGLFEAMPSAQRNMNTIVAGWAQRPKDKNITKAQQIENAVKGAGLNPYDPKDQAAVNDIVNSFEPSKDKNITKAQQIENAVSEAGLSPYDPKDQAAVKAIVDTFEATKDGSKHKIDSGTKAYDQMVATANKFGVDTNEPILPQYSKLSTTAQGKLNAEAEDYFKQSGQKLMPSSELGKHIHTLGNMSKGSLQGIKESAGLTDSVINSLTEYFTSDEGTEFKKYFQQTFNNLLTLSGDRVDKAELDNLRDAYGSLAKSNAVVFSNFKSMLEAMKSQVQAYANVNPVAGEILYGNELNAYTQIINAMGEYGQPSSQGQVKTVITQTGEMKPGLDMSGAI